MPPAPTISPLEPIAPGEVARLAIIVSRYNRRITNRLLEGAVHEHQRLTGGGETPVIISAPGSFELPHLAMCAARTGGFDAVVALGCIIKGETSHDRHISTSVVQGLMNVSLETGIAVGLGVLTVDDVAQAEARAGGSMGNKGAEAMAAALASAGAGRAIVGRPAS